MDEYMQVYYMIFNKISDLIIELQQMKKEAEEIIICSEYQNYIKSNTGHLN